VYFLGILIPGDFLKIRELGRLFDVRFFPHLGVGLISKCFQKRSNNCVVMDGNISIEIDFVY
jgi:hypothetical protein